MAIQTKQGHLAVIEKTFVDLSMAPVDPDAVRLRIYRPDGFLQFVPAVLDHPSVGHFSYTYPVPENAVFGYWRTEWTTVTAGVEATFNDTMEVIAWTTQERVVILNKLRFYTGERIPVGLDATATNFTDDELIQVFSDSGENFDLSILAIWQAKSAHYAGMIDREESDSRVPLSQLYRQANNEVTRWTQKVALIKPTGGFRVPQVGRPIAWAKDPCLVYGEVLWTPMGNRA